MIANTWSIIAKELALNAGNFLKTTSSSQLLGSGAILMGSQAFSVNNYLRDDNMIDAINAHLDAGSTIKEIAKVYNDNGKLLGYVARSEKLVNGESVIADTFVDISFSNVTATQDIIDAAIPLFEGGNSKTLNAGDSYMVCKVLPQEMNNKVTGMGVTTVKAAANAIIETMHSASDATWAVVNKIDTLSISDITNALKDAGKTIGDQVISYFSADENDTSSYYDEETYDIIKNWVENIEVDSGGGNIEKIDQNETFQAGLKKVNELMPQFPTYNDWMSFNSQYITNTTQQNQFTNIYNTIFNRDDIEQKIGTRNPAIIFNTDGGGGTIDYFAQVGIINPDNQATVTATTNGSQFQCRASDYTNSATYYMSSIMGSIRNTGWLDCNDSQPLLSKSKSILSNNIYSNMFSSTSKIKLDELDDSNAEEITQENENQDEDKDNKKKIFPFFLPISNPLITSDDYIPTTNEEVIEEKVKENPNVNPVPNENEEENPNPNPITPGINDDPVDPNNDDDDGIENKVPFLPMLDFRHLANVYNPTRAEIQAVGDYLWDATHLIDILKIFQNPMDGIISLNKIFCIPTTSGTDEIYLGYLPTGVTSKIVVSQLTVVNCGSVYIPEDKYNALDYSPYTSVEIYLPFIGFKTLNAYEVVGRTVNVTYRIDVFTGACIAQITVNNGEHFNAVMYEFSGNCAIQIPLTSSNLVQYLANFTGNIISQNVSNSNLLHKTSNIVNSVIHDSVHIERTSNLDSNIGMLGNRKPYIVVRRFMSYDAANYNQYYGYPINKTVYLKNHTGYTKVKNIILHTSASSEEREEILRLLHDGIYI